MNRPTRIPVRGYSPRTIITIVAIVLSCASIVGQSNEVVGQSSASLTQVEYRSYNNSSSTTAFTGISIKTEADDLSSYYGKPAFLSNIAFNRSLPPLIPESRIDSIEDMRIATWYHMPRNDSESQHKHVKSYVLSYFLKRQRENRYWVVLYVLAMFMERHHFFVPKLRLSIDYENTAFVNISCSLVLQNEQAHRYDKSRDIQAHMCLVPGNLSTQLNDEETPILYAKVRAEGHEEQVSLLLREYLPERGHVRPERVYNYTLVTLLKTSHMRCRKQMCDLSSMERLPEYVAHHLLLGFDHLYLYCVDGWTQVTDMLKPFILMDKVSVIVANDLHVPPLGDLENAQVVAFSTHVERYREYSRYCMIVDVDEFVYVLPNLQLSKKWQDPLPPHLDTMLSKLMYKLEYNAQRENRRFCAASLSWFTISRDPKPTSPRLSVILNYHSSLYREPYIQEGAGNRKTMTKSMYTSPYSNQHVTSFSRRWRCERTIVDVSDAFLVHFRIKDRNSGLPVDNYSFKHYFMIPLYSSIEKLLIEMKIWSSTL